VQHQLARRCGGVDGLLIKVQVDPDCLETIDRMGRSLIDLLNTIETPRP
jgi:hypothetical protein